MNKNSILTAAAMFVLTAALSACAETGASEAAESRRSISEVSDGIEGTDGTERLSIVCTNFPEYDFARQIVGDKADVTMLLKLGAESHTYEPSPEDIITIQNSDMFVYVGGDSDAWVDGILDSMDQSRMAVFKLMDQVQTVEEETVEGMEPEEEGEEKEEEEAVTVEANEAEELPAEEKETEEGRACLDFPQECSNYRGEDGGRDRSP